MVFYRNLNNIRSFQVFKTLFRILTNLPKTLVLIDSVRLLVNLHFASPSPSSSLTFFSYFARSKHLSLFWLSLVFIHWPSGTTKSAIWRVIFFFLLTISRSVYWAGLGDLFEFKNTREFPASNIPWWILVIAFTQISISCSVPNESPFLPSRV